MKTSPSQYVDDTGSIVDDDDDDNDDAVVDLDADDAADSDASPTTTTTTPTPSSSKSPASDETGPTIPQLFASAAVDSPQSLQQQQHQQQTSPGKPTSSRPFKNQKGRKYLMPMVRRCRG